MKKFTAILMTTALLTSVAGAHCQIPCGIYDDNARFTLMNEHVSTIEKSMTEIAKLSAEDPQQNNQLVRWVMNKEDHADQLSEIVTYYFLAQRIKAPADTTDAVAQEKYREQLELLHGIMVQAMKAKQTVDLQHVETLRKLIHDFQHVYFGEKETAHTH